MEDASGGTTMSISDWNAQGENAVPFTIALDDMPNEMISCIFSFLTIEQLFIVERVSKKWRILAQPVKLKKAPIWRWGNTIERKSPSVSLDAARTCASRPSKEGHNPAILSEDPLTRERNHFRLEIRKLGNWIGIGVADLDFQIDGGSTLGTQRKGVNSSYFWQSSGIRKIQMYSEDKQEAHPISRNDILDVIIDFDAQKIQYWLNGALQGAIACKKHKLVEGSIYACVNLSVGSEVAFKNDDRALLNLPRMIEDILEEQPKQPFPTMWRWGMTPTRRAASIDVDEKRLTATRKSGGHNPSIMTTLPFSKRHFFFRVQIKELGNWIGIGLGDKAFSLNCSSTLGTQTRGLNSCYFFQTSGINRLQMYGEPKIEASKLSPMDVVSVRVDFDTQKIIYYLNDIQQGSISCNKYKLVEGKVFPCVNMSTGTSVTILNVNSDPLVKSPNGSTISSLFQSIKKKLF